MENQQVKKKKTFKMPHTYVVLFVIMFSVFLLTHVVPGGEFQRVKDPVSGNTVVVPGTFTYTEVDSINLFDLFVTLQRGYIKSSDIIFMIIFAYSFVYVLTKNGTLDTAISLMVRKIGNKVELLIPISMLLFGFLGSTLGIFEEVYGLFPVFVGLFIALGYDGIVGGAAIFVGLGVGFAASTLNPYSIVVAQDICGLPLYSGLTLRIIVFFVAEFVAIAYTMNYARKIKADPTKSYMYGMTIEGIEMKNLDDLKDAKLTKSHKASLLIFVAVIIGLVFGTIKLGWYINEIAALFIIAFILAGIVSGYSTTEISKSLVEGAKQMATATMTVGFSRAILLLMQDASITDTIVFNLSSLLEGTSAYVSAYGMLLIQCVVKLFVAGSFSQATLTMPILGPTAELLGLSKQIAVLAYQFANGFPDMFFPNAIVFATSLMGVPMNIWYKFITKLFLLFALVAFAFMTIAVAINYA